MWLCFSLGAALVCLASGALLITARWKSFAQDSSSSSCRSVQLPITRLGHVPKEKTGFTRSGPQRQLSPGPTSCQDVGYQPTVVSCSPQLEVTECGMTWHAAPRRCGRGPAAAAPAAASVPEAPAASAPAPAQRPAAACPRVTGGGGRSRVPRSLLLAAAALAVLLALPRPAAAAAGGSSGRAARRLALVPQRQRSPGPALKPTAPAGAPPPAKPPARQQAANAPRRPAAAAATPSPEPIPAIAKPLPEAQPAPRSPRHGAGGGSADAGAPLSGVPLMLSPAAPRAAKAPGAPVPAPKGVTAGQLKGKAAAAAAAPAAAAPGGRPCVFRIGCLVPLSGPSGRAAEGKAVQAAIQMAIRDIAPKRLPGVKVELACEDTQCSEAPALRAAAGLVQSGRADVLIGDVCSAASLAALSVANNFQIPMVSPASGAAVLAAKDYFFRTVPSDTHQGLFASRWLQSQGVKSLLVAVSDDSYGHGLADSLVAAFSRDVLPRGGAARQVVVAPRGAGAAAAQQASARGRLGASRVDTGGRKALVKALRAARPAPAAKLFAASALMAPPLAAAAGAAGAAGVRGADAGFGSPAFAAAFGAFTKGKLPYSSAAARAYDAAWALLEARAAAAEPKRGPQLLAALQRVSLAQGKSGAVAFDANGDRAVPRAGDGYGVVEFSKGGQQGAAAHKLPLSFVPGSYAAHAGGAAARWALLIGSAVLLCTLGAYLALSRAPGPAAAAAGGAPSASRALAQQLEARLRDAERAAVELRDARRMELAELKQQRPGGASAGGGGAAGCGGTAADAGAPPRRPAPDARPLLIEAAPPLDTARLLASLAERGRNATAGDAAAAGVGWLAPCLARVAALLDRHRAAPRPARGPAAARAAYASALAAAVRDAGRHADAAMAAARAGGAAAVAAAPRRPQAPSAAPGGEDAAAAGGAAAAPGSAEAAAAGMIAEALLAVEDAANRTAAAKGGEPVLVPCGGGAADPSLPPALPPGRRVLVAANLRNSEAVMPNFVVQLLALVVAQGEDGAAPARGPGGEGEEGAAPVRGPGGKAGGGESSVFVSVYESGSKAGDATGDWLLLLRMLLEPIAVPSNITARGGLTRAAGQERIEFLAAARNALLPDVAAAPRLRAAAAAAAAAAASASGMPLADAPEVFAARDVLFVNDVFFCAGHARRLLWLDADVAAAFDFGAVDNHRTPGHEAGQRRRLAAARAGGGGGGGSELRPERGEGGALAGEVEQEMQPLEPPPPPPPPPRGSQRLALGDAAAPQQAAGAAAATPPGAAPAAAPGGALVQVVSEAKKASAPAAAKRAPAEKLPFARMVEAAAAQAAGDADKGHMRFPAYDVWVFRDQAGQRLRWSPPYGNSKATTRALSRGLPFPAYCAWGGMAKVVAQPFADGLRFRKHLDGECKASECSLLCDDLHRLGYRRVLVDPAARTAYDMPTAWALLSGAVDLKAVAGVGGEPWAHVASRGAAAAAEGAPRHRRQRQRVNGTLAAADGAGAGAEGGGAAAPAAAGPAVAALSSAGVDWDAAGSVPDYAEIDCCHKGDDPKLDYVVFQDCRPSDVLHRNYTQYYFGQCQITGQHDGAGGGANGNSTSGGGSSGGGSGGGGQLPRALRLGPGPGEAAAAAAAKLQSGYPAAREEGQGEGRERAARGGLVYLTSRQRHADGAWHSPVWAACPP
ncbi:MAG: hypothetical protein J3K34DRAFT_458716 [Monoraphidium minutum]|nr:MAG: hypothetical protein J3K34DRAFT_458716 [Monoraphidium minutum]